MAFFMDKETTDAAIRRALGVDEFITLKEAARRRSQLAEAMAATVCTDERPSIITGQSEPMLPGMYETTGQLFDPGNINQTAIDGERRYRLGMMDD